MSKTANINVRIDPEFKSEVENLYSKFGMSVTDAINIFLHVSVMEGGLPFEVRQPRYNAETEAAMKEARAIAKGDISAKKYSSAKEMINDVLAEDNVNARTHSHKQIQERSEAHPEAEKRSKPATRCAADASGRS